MKIRRKRLKSVLQIPWFTTENLSEKTNKTTCWSEQTKQSEEKDQHKINWTRKKVDFEDKKRKKVFKNVILLHSKYVVNDCHKS